MCVETYFRGSITFSFFPKLHWRGVALLLGFLIWIVDGIIGMRLIGPLSSFGHTSSLDLFSVHKPQALVMVDGVCFSLKPLFWFQTQHLFVWNIQGFVVSVFHSCASTTDPFKLLQNLAMFLEVTWPSSLECFLIGVFLRTYALAIQHASVDLLQLRLQGHFSSFVILSFGKEFFPGGFSFSPLVRGYVVLGYLSRPRCRDPMFSLFPPYVSLMGVLEFQSG